LNDDHNKQQGSSGLSADASAPTEVSDASPETTDTPQNSPSKSNDYTTYRGSSDTAETGFDTAKKIAENASASSGKLLKKRFVLEDIMGEGGMGRVYRASDLRKIEAEDKNPYVAVKVLGQSFQAHPKAFVALQQEAVKSQKLAHPNVVTVHDFDRDGDTIFMTMELLKGDPLDQLIKLAAPFSKELALRYFNDLCAGLDYAHERGLIHSDFKPGNIFVTTNGTVKILDFGIARAATSNVLSHDYDAGELGALTPAYATVEMIEGKPPSFSDDVYALACVLYLMLTGEHPYQRKSATSTRDQALSPAPIPCLSKQEWQTLEAALSFDVNRRPSTIEDFLNGMAPRQKTNRIPYLAAGITIVAMVAGGFYYQQLRVDQQRENELNASIGAAKDCFVTGDYACAVENALVVRKLAPGNSEAASLLARAQEKLLDQGLEQDIEQKLEQARQCLAMGDFDCSSSLLKAVLLAKPDEGQALQLQLQVESDRNDARIAKLIGQANDCLADGDLLCANAALVEARQSGAKAQQLAPSQQQLTTLQAKQNAADQKRTAEITAVLAQARKCLEKGDFDCSEKHLGELLQLDPLNTDAISLQQANTAARSQSLANERLVAGILKEATECETRKNYSCAIAKSEAALAIIPGQRKATAIAERAKLAQQQAKRAITIE